VDNDLTRSHWNEVYQKKEVENLGWYEENPEPSLKLINNLNIAKDAALLNVGAGATTLIDELLDNEYNNIIANDISYSSLEKLKNRLGTTRSNNVNWIVDDLTNSQELIKLNQIDLWHDRAVLHFFTDNQGQDAYFNLVRKLVKKGGYVIIAVFNLNGATKCSGLPVVRYNEQLIKNGLGDDFELLESFDYTYTMPSGDLREYIYTLYQRSYSKMLKISY
jgi:ubiquinone/menaquinone biosynthesis C-methylase UbiE